jgi:hypothetical protein
MHVVDSLLMRLEVDMGEVHVGESHDCTLALGGHRSQARGRHNNEKAEREAWVPDCDE